MEGAGIPALPEGQVGILATVGAEGPVPVPVSALHRLDAERLLVALARRRASLTRLREDPRVGMSLSGPSFSLTLVGRASVLADPLPGAEAVAGILVVVERAWDARGLATEVTAGIDWRWTEEAAAARHAGVLAALADLARTSPG